MRNEKSILRPIFAIICCGIIIQYELREYYRYSAESYWPAKFFLQYGTALLIGIPTIFFSIKSVLRRKKIRSNFSLIIFVFGLCSILYIRSLTSYTEIEFREGLAYEVSDGTLADGTYKTSSSWDGFGSDEHCSKEQYIDGVPSGKWMYSYKGDLIHSGEYLSLPKLQKEIISLSSSERCDINLYQEGNYPLVSIKLVNPELTDSITLFKIKQLVINEMSTKYDFNEVDINGIVDNENVWF